MQSQLLYIVSLSYRLLSADCIKLNQILQNCQTESCASTIFAIRHANVYDHNLFANVLQPLCGSIKLKIRSQLDHKKILTLQKKLFYSS